MSGSLDVLNVAMGDLKLTWDEDDEKDVAQAKSTVEMLLKQGYAIVVETAKGKHIRVKEFDPEADEYILVPDPDDVKTKSKRKKSGSTGKKRGRPKTTTTETRVSRSSTTATAIGRSAGG